MPYMLIAINSFLHIDYLTFEESSSKITEIHCNLGLKFIDIMQLIPSINCQIQYIYFYQQ